MTIVEGNEGLCDACVHGLCAPLCVDPSSGRESPVRVQPVPGSFPGCSSALADTFEWLRGRTLISESVAPHQWRVHTRYSRPRETEQVRVGYVLDAKKNPVVNVPSALTGLFTVTSKQASGGNPA